MDDIVKNISTQNGISNGSTIYQAEITNEYRMVADQMEIKILRELADKYIEQHGDEIIAMIDMDKLGKQINAKVLATALRTLAKENSNGR